MQNLDLPQTSRAQQFDFNHFSFGETPTDHLFLAEYKGGNWSSLGVQPFQNLTLSPFALCFHYGQTVFEGMKAFRLANGSISIFRPDKHYDRLSKSLERMSMPVLPRHLFLEGLTHLILKDQTWLPTDRTDIALYIRPFVIATEARLGVKVSSEYLFAVACTPIGEYYDKPLKVKVETQYARAAEGGAGYAKFGGNYGGAFYPTQKAVEAGFDQVIWTDAKTHECLEEAGTMNIMMYVHGTLVTPPVSSSILDGITRDSIIQIAKDLNILFEERAISCKELQGYFENDERVELFGVGTAAIVSSMSCVQINGTDYFPYTETGAVMFTLKNELEAIRRGEQEDKHNWNYLIS
ncbi:branched-chain amino acid aminotransferase [Dyadobacter crusticola]|uniref:branched-chain amino acid aminotransferase n=1 Tax=Dyadobacter crusticola TaxID=292407 RepID=UPI0004E15FFF|nr:branched-chain amino acid aminotransferase [Dyadobacter crusticola]